MSLSKLALGLALTLFTAPAFAAQVLELDCRIDNSVMSSVPRTIKLRTGMIETIDCQTHRTCKNSIYQITMNYNNAYEQVSVSITDTETNKTMGSVHVLAPNTTGDSLNNALLDIGYGDVVTSMNDIPELDRKGRFLKISCERMN